MTFGDGIGDEECARQDVPSLSIGGKWGTSTLMLFPVSSFISTLISPPCIFFLFIHPISFSSFISSLSISFSHHTSLQQLNNTMASSSAVRFIAASKKSPLGSLQIHLHVKPGASKDRQGVSSVTDTAVDLCISAQARKGEANKAVISVLSDILRVPKSTLSMSHGLKSRYKTVVLEGLEGLGLEYAETVLNLLGKASH